MNVVTTMVTMKLKLKRNILNTEAREAGNSPSTTIRTGSTRHGAVCASRSSAVLRKIITPLGSLHLVGHTVTASSRNGADAVPLLTVLGRPLGAAKLNPVRVNVDITRLRRAKLRLTTVSNDSHNRYDCCHVENGARPVNLVIVSRHVLQVSI